MRVFPLGWVLPLGEGVIIGVLPLASGCYHWRAGVTIDVRVLPLG